MNTVNPIVVWYVIAGLVLFVFLCQFVWYLRSEYHHGRPDKHLFDMSDEREMFYAPGDRLNKDVDDEFDDL